MWKERYKIKKKLEEGGMTEAFLGLDSGTNEKVVIKVTKEKYSTPSIIKALMEINSILIKVEHPSLAKVLDFWEEHGRLYTVTKFIEGRKLSKIRTNKEIILELLLQMMEGVSFIHSLGYVLSDIKPDNIIVGDRATIVDYSSMRPISREAAFISGTPKYECPEIRQPIVDERCDVYSIGIILGKFGFNQLAGRATRKRPEERYDNVQQIIREVRSLRKSGYKLYIGTRSIKLDSEVTVGRSNQAKLKLEDPGNYLDKVHGKFIKKDERTVLYIDLNSVNGSYIYRNGKYERIEETLVKDGDVIALCYSNLRGPYRLITFREN